MPKPEGRKPYHLLLPRYPNHVWHMDMTCIKVLWFTFYVVAILDGFSRKLLTLRVFYKTPHSRDMVRLIRQAVKEFGKPQFLITDHGCQFRCVFHDAMKRRFHLRHVRSKVRTPYLNGKIERAFRPFKFWWLGVLLSLVIRSIQRRLDDYQFWYNEHRIHSALGVLTPQEAWDGVEPPTPIPIRAADQKNVQVFVTRTKCRGDPRLRVLQINVCRQAA